MDLHITGDGDGFAFQLKLQWRALRALVGAVSALLAGLGIPHLGALLGWW